MFKLAHPDTLYPTEVDILVPAADGAETQRATLLFRCLGVTEFADLSRQGDAALLERAIGGWEGILDHEGRPVEFGSGRLGELLDLPFFVQGAVNGYLDRFTLRKNS